MNYKSFLKFELVCIIYTVIFFIADLVGFAKWPEVFAWLMLTYSVLRYLPNKFKSYVGGASVCLICLLTRFIAIPYVFIGTIEASQINLNNLNVSAFSGMISALFVTIYCVTANYSSAWIIYKKLVSAVTYEDIRENTFYRKQGCIRFHNTLTTCIALTIIFFLYKMWPVLMGFLLFLLIVLASSMLFSYVIETARTKRMSEILKKVNEEIEDVQRE